MNGASREELKFGVILPPWFGQIAGYPLLRALPDGFQWQGRHYHEHIRNIKIENWMDSFVNMDASLIRPKST